MEKKIIRTITEILKKNDAVKVSIFGSFARGEEREGSDIDLLVEFARYKSPFLFLLGPVIHQETIVETSIVANPK